MPKNALVVSAHSADFVWRAAGDRVGRRGRWDAHVVSLSYRERGESGELWKQPDQTEERVKEIRHAEALAATLRGADFRSLDLGDYPLVMDAAAVERLTRTGARARAAADLTHAALDPFPTPTTGSRTTREARQLARARASRARSRPLRRPSC